MARSSTFGRALASALALSAAAGCGGIDSAGLGPDPDPSAAYQGTWVGKWGTGTASPASDYTIIAGVNKVLIVYNGLAGTGAPQGHGTWGLVNGSFRGTYVYTEGDTLFVAGALANNGTRLQGDWGRGTTVSGTYWVDRQ